MRTRKEMLLLRKLTYEEEQELIKMYKKVEEDFEKFPEIKTTEDLFRWREQVKGENQEDGELRNRIIEERIKGNDSLELLHAWSQFSCMVQSAKSNVNDKKFEFGIEDRDKYRIKAAGMLHKRLVEKKQAYPERLFGIYQIRELSLGIRYPIDRTLNTTYEYEKALVKEDEQESWPAVLFVALMKAYGIDSDTLLEVGRAAETMSKEYIADMAVEYDAQLGNQSMDIHKVHEKK